MNAIHAAARWTLALLLLSHDSLRSAEKRGGAPKQFPKRDRPKASPIPSPQPPPDHVFYRAHTAPKSRRSLFHGAVRLRLREFLVEQEARRRGRPFFRPSSMVRQFFSECSRASWSALLS